jgi:hypothetical protein
MKESSKDTEEQSVATSVAKAVGGALGTIASVATALIPTTSTPTNGPRFINKHAERASLIKKIKRAKHRRKLGRRTRG